MKLLFKNHRGFVFSIGFIVILLVCALIVAAAITILFNNNEYITQEFTSTAIEIQHTVAFHTYLAHPSTNPHGLTLAKAIKDNSATSIHARLNDFSSQNFDEIRCWKLYDANNKARVITQKTSNCESDDDVSLKAHLPDLNKEIEVVYG